ncbi:MAG: MFS transporter [Acetobacteraceae bacterium]|nr:MFS transporter [Acetobacteraceae bacterium]
MRASMLSPFRHRPFLLLFCGQVVSNAGDWLDFLALSALVAYRWNLGPGALAAVTAARMIPLAVCGPFAGVWADRLPRRTLMIWCDLVRAGLVAGLCAGAWIETNLYVILVLVAFKGMASALFDPAQQGAIRALVPEEDLLAANSLSTLSLQSTKVVAPLLGGVLVAAYSPVAAFAADSASFVVSAAFLSRLPPLRVGGVAGSEVRRGFWAELWGGVRYVFSRRALALAVSAMAAGVFLMFLYDSFLPLLTKSAGIGESGFGLVVGSIALGGILGAMAAGQWGKGANPLRLMVVCSVSAGCFVGGAGLVGLGYGVGSALAWQAALWFFTGLAGGAMQVFIAYILQVETPRELMGRVWSIANTLQNVLPFVAPGVGAALAARVGVGSVFVIGGAGYLVLGTAAGIAARVLRISLSGAAHPAPREVPARGAGGPAGAGSSVEAGGPGP